MGKNREKQLSFLENKPAIALGILTITLAATNLWLFFSYVSDKKNDSGEKADRKYEFLDPAHDFYEKKDLIVDIQPLRDELNSAGENDKNISVYFEFLSTGANISVNKDAKYFPASLLKVPVAMAVAKKIEKGEWKWTNELVLMSSDKDFRFGDLHKNEIGARFTIETLTEKALMNSDNTANNILMRNLDPKELFDVYQYLGLGDFFSNEGKISAKNYSAIWRALYSAAYLNEKDSQKIISILSKSPFKDYLESGLPDGMIFSHKIGVSDEQGVYMDAGIVYAANRPYFLAVMVNTPDAEKAKMTMKKISKSVYDYVANYKNNN